MDSSDLVVMLRRFVLLSVASLCLLGAGTFGRAAQGAELVMFQAAGCIWCARWDREIAAIYPKTAEGRAAPLRRVDLGQPRPRDLNHIAGIVFTPTFVLIDQGREIGRITGYPGESHFWGLLGELISRLPRHAHTNATAEHAKVPAQPTPSEGTK